MGIPRKAGQQLGLGLGVQGEVQIQAVNQGNGLAFAGIHTALHQPMALELGRREPQPLAHRKHQIGLTVIEGQFQLT